MDDIEEFKYNKELFHGFSTILQGIKYIYLIIFFYLFFILDVREQVPQEKLAYAMVETIKNDSRVREHATSI